MVLNFFMKSSCLVLSTSVKTLVQSYRRTTNLSITAINLFTSSRVTASVFILSRALVSSGKMFHASQAVFFFPQPVKNETVSHPLIA